MKKFIFIAFLLASPSAFADDSGFLDSILNYIKGIYNAIVDFVEWIGLIVIEVFKALWTLLTDLIIWTLESLLSLAAELLSGIAEKFNFNAISSQVSSLWSAIPPEVAAILSAIGLPSALAIIATGILIRFALQLIPFVRLGS